MDLNFYKLQTAGNDLILINFTGELFPPDHELREMSRKICRRDYGIGSNGLIAMTSEGIDKVKASFLTPSGEFADVVNDALMCLARYIFDSGFSGKNDFSVEINGRLHKVGVIDSTFFRISLGYPLNSDGLPLIERPEEDYLVSLTSGGKKIPSTIIQLGKPGVVIYTENRSFPRLKEIADDLIIPEKLSEDTQVIFATVNSRDDLEVFIRKSRNDDFLSSCAIAAVASVLNGFSDRDTAIHHKQSEMFFQWMQPTNEVFITSSAEYLFTGSFYYET